MAERILYDISKMEARELYNVLTKEVSFNVLIIVLYLLNKDVTSALNKKNN